MSKYREDGTEMSYGVECMDATQMQTSNQAEETQLGDLSDLLTPASPQTLVNTIQQQHCETCV